MGEKSSSCALCGLDGARSTECHPDDNSLVVCQDANIVPQVASPPNTSHNTTKTPESGANRDKLKRFWGS